jgi:WD40 repeat protein/TPR repeat protein
MGYRLLLVDASGTVTTPTLAIRQLREFPGGTGLSVHFRPVRSDRLFESAKAAGQLAYRVLAGEGIVRSQLWVEYEVVGDHANVTGRSADLLFALALITAKWPPNANPYPTIAATGSLGLEPGSSDGEAEASVCGVHHTAQKVAAAVHALEREPAAVVFYPAKDHDVVAAWQASAAIPSSIKIHAVSHLEEALSILGIGLEKVFLRNPFRGLEQFNYEHHPIFFGRNKEIHEVVAQLLRREAAGACGLMIEGASGSGKSSFLRAGVMPALIRSSALSVWETGKLQSRPVDPKAAHAVWRPGLIAPPIDERKLTESVRECWRAFSEWQTPVPFEPDLTLESLADRFRECWPASRRFVWLIDQFEEIFTWDPQAPYIELLGRFLLVLQKAGVWTLVSIRADSVPLLKSHETLRTVFGSNEGQYYLAPMRGMALDEVIALPARAADLSFGRGPNGETLDQLLREEAYRESDSLPLLQFTLNELYLRRSGRELCYPAYQELGGISGSIKTIAHSILQPREAVPGFAVHRLFRNLVSVNEHGRATRRYAPLADIAADADQHALVKQLVAARLCSTDQREGLAVVAFAHDTLLHTLPALIDWLAQEAGLLQIRESAARDSQIWRQNGRLPAWLAPGDKLATFAALERSKIPISGETREFIAHSRRRAHRVTGIKRAAVVVITGLAAIASVAGWMASKKQKEAEQQTAKTLDAQSRLLTETAADQLKDGDLAYARGIIMEVLGRTNLSDSTVKAALNVFQEIRALDPQILVLSGVTAYVRRGGFSPDGMRAVTALNDGTARVWDTTTGMQLQVFQAGQENWAMCADFSADGNRLMTVADSIRVWDARSGKLLRDIRDEADFHTAYFSPDGKRIVAASGVIKIWDAETGQQLAVLQQKGLAFGLARFSPDGQRVVATASDNSGRIWDLKSGKMVASLRGHLDRVTSIVYSPDGARILTSSYDATARLWDAQSGALLLALLGHRGQVWDAEFSADGARVVTVGTDKVAIIWDARSGSRLATLTGHSAILSSATFSKDGSRVLTTAYDGTARVWNSAAGGKALTLTAAGKRMTGVEYSPDGRKVMTTAEDNAVRVWDARSGAPLFGIQNEGTIKFATFSPDGTRILLGTDGSLREMDAATGKSIRPLSIETEKLQGAAYSRDGRRIVTWDEDPFGVRIWDANSGAELLKVTGYEQPVQNAEFSPDDTQLLTSSTDKTGRVWDARSGKQLIIYPHSDHLNSGYYSHDGSRVVTSSNDGLVRIWDAHSARLLNVLTGNRTFVYSAVFSPDGHRVISGSRDNVVRIWDSDTGMPLAVLAGHDARIPEVAYSPDGTQIASASIDGTVRLWNADIQADPSTQIAWQQAAMSDPLSAAQQTMIGLEAAPGSAGHWAGATDCDRAAGAYYDPDRLAPGLLQTEIASDVALAACRQSGTRKDEPRRIYETGRSLVAQNDIAGAARAFEQAISRGYRVAGVDLGDALQQSESKPVDLTRIANIYRQAWNDGVAMAGFRLGRMAEAQSTAPSDQETAWLWYKRAAAMGQPDAIARLGRRSEDLALIEATPDKRYADLLEALSLYSKAAAIAEAESWPDEAWRQWRYRRSDLARYLAREGMMRQVADAFRNVTRAGGDKQQSR